MVMHASSVFRSDTGSRSTNASLGLSATCSRFCSHGSVLVSRWRVPISSHSSHHPLQGLQHPQIGGFDAHHSRRGPAALKASKQQPQPQPVAQPVTHPQLRGLSHRFQSLESLDMDPTASNASKLNGLGFTGKEADRFILSRTLYKQEVDFEDTWQWIQLLQHYHVPAPYAELSRSVSSLETKALVAAEILQHFGSMDFTVSQIEYLLYYWPALSDKPPENLPVIAAWLKAEIDSSGGDVFEMMKTWPSIFAEYPRWSWFQSLGFNKVSMHPTHSDDSASLHNLSSAELTALKALGLQSIQLAEIAQHPTLIDQIMSSDKVQQKTKYLVEIVGVQPRELVSCPAALDLSLVDTIGPQWAFHQLYCSKVSFQLSKHLADTDEEFLYRLPSYTIDAECNVRDLSRMQLYESFKAEWQLGVGKYFST